ncbi:hypothetical protein ACSQ67_020864 [Phaseolus vulgaris]
MALSFSSAANTTTMRNDFITNPKDYGTLTLLSTRSCKQREKGALLGIVGTWFGDAKWKRRTCWDATQRRIVVSIEGFKDVGWLDEEERVVVQQGICFEVLEEGVRCCYARIIMQSRLQ